MTMKDVLCVATVAMAALCFVAFVVIISTDRAHRLQGSARERKSRVLHYRTGVSPLFQLPFGGEHPKRAP
jgi:hypothetical protein